MIESMLIPSRFHKVVHFDWLGPPHIVQLVIFNAPIIKHGLVKNESQECLSEIVY
jgi:hypothetical protein